VVIATLILFLIANGVFALIDPPISRLSLLNGLLPGFQRFPNPRVPGEKNGTLTFSGEIARNLDMLFPAHIISAREKPKEEYRVILIGDSSAWGAGLHLEQTMTEQINQAQLMPCEDRQIVVYNLGYPGVSAIKDLLILSESAKSYHPDLMIWSFTLTTFVSGKGRDNAYAADNYERFRALEESSGYYFGSKKFSSGEPSFIDRTLYGRRGELNYLLRLHLFDLKSMSLGTDYLGTPEDIDFVQGPAGNKNDFLEFRPGDDIEEILDINLFLAAGKISGTVPILYFNEPIYIEENNPVRYNQVYPRWVYDLYRELFDRVSKEQSWIYLDLWNALPPDEFVDTVFHRTFEGETRVAQALIPVIQAEACKK